MHKIMILMLLPLLASASYNPFFKPNKPITRQKVTKVNVRQVAKKPDVRPNVNLSYFAFLETSPLITIFGNFPYFAVQGIIKLLGEAVLEHRKLLL